MMLVYFQRFSLPETHLVNSTELKLRNFKPKLKNFSEVQTRLVYLIAKSSEQLIMGVVHAVN